MPVQEQRLAAQSADEPSVLEQLSAHPLFGCLPRPALADLVSSAMRRRYRRGHRLFHAGDRSLAVFYVKSGLVALTGLDERGNEAIALTFSTGEAFGQATAVLGLCHPWTATAVVDTEVLLIPRPAFVDIYRRFPDLASEIIRGLCDMLYRSQQTAIRLALAPANSRVATFLLERASKAAVPEPDRPGFELDLSHQDLALLLGTARETVTRILTVLARAGVIAVQDRRVFILRPDALRRMAESDPRRTVPLHLGPVTNVTAAR